MDDYDYAYEIVYTNTYAFLKARLEQVFSDPSVDRHEILDGALDALTDALSAAKTDASKGIV